MQLASASAAASLAETNKKSVELWKPGSIPAANKAALRAADYELDPLWQPQMSAAGSKAATQAHREGPTAELDQGPESEHGQSAAGQAFVKKTTGPISSRDVPEDSHRKALMAAAGAMSGSRRRADSAPIRPREDSAWAVKAASRSQKGGSSPLMQAARPGDPGLEAARIQHMPPGKVPRQMYGSKPPVALEVEEKNRQDTLRASALAMAQKMYAIQQTHIDEAKGIERRGHRRTTSDLSTSNDEGDGSVAPGHYNLEEAARKLAQERLAKLQKEHDEFRIYYGQPSQPRSRLSFRLRRRATSAGEVELADEEQSRRIRSQMSIFQNQLAEVDQQKRQQDRDALMAAAHRNVQARMAEMDEKVFLETGKSSPHQRELWEQQAREKAAREAEQRTTFDKVHIGGGKYMDQSELDAIARARVQPTLDEISEKAEEKRAKDEELKREMERIKREVEADKVRDAQAKAEQRAARGTSPSMRNK